MNITVDKTLLIYFNFSSLGLLLMAMMICSPDSFVHSIFVSFTVHL